MNLLNDLLAITRTIPDKVTVSIAAREQSDIFADGVDFEARRQPQDSSDVGGYDQTTARWQVYATASQTMTPKRQDQLTDASGNVWQITRVTTRFGNLIHDCDCVAHL